MLLLLSAGTQVVGRIISFCIESSIIHIFCLLWITKWITKRVFS